MLLSLALMCGLHASIRATAPDKNIQYCPYLHKNCILSQNSCTQSYFEHFEYRHSVAKLININCSNVLVLILHLLYMCTFQLNLPVNTCNFFNNSILEFIVADTLGCLLTLLFEKLICIFFDKFKFEKNS